MNVAANMNPSLKLEFRKITNKRNGNYSVMQTTTSATFSRI